MEDKAGLGLETFFGLCTKVAVTHPRHDLTIAHTPGVLDSTPIFQDVESPEVGWGGREKELLMCAFSGGVAFTPGWL